MGGQSRSVVKGRSRPEIEALEGRVVLATFNASNVSQLVTSIAQAAATPGANTILLAPGNYITRQAIQIRGVQDLTIQPKTANTSVNLIGAVVDRVLTIDGGNVTLKNLTVSNGGGVIGAGIGAQNANLTLQGVRVFNNVATGAAGGVFVQNGSLNVQSSTILDNRVSRAGGAGGGGIVALNAATNISASVIQRNSVFAVDLTSGNAVTGMGSGIYTAGGTLAITGSTITQNTVNSSSIGTSSQAFGAGVYTTNTASTVTNTKATANGLSTFATQTAVAQGSAFATVGGSLAVSNSTISGNGPKGWASFYNQNATVTVTNSTLDGSKITGTKTL
ncbi:hypothetical protein [Aquisphaera insulae]|uniref:hypothetical protein n=1 Tax=Aquisphaera insulae TaxID=2712864 RepID=UPI0013EA829B|nr:hypothetical protein [Aquisphaera insulae]